MKRLILIASTALVLAAEAKLEKMADITLADQQSLVNAASKIGGFVNEPMLAMMPAGLYAGNPLATMGFGPARADGRFYGALYLDGSATVDFMQLASGDKVKFALLYPVTSAKADFLAANAQAKEVNGVIDLNGMSVIFSKDGKYAAIASDAAAARLIVADVADIPAVKNGEAFRVRAFKPFLQVMVNVMESDEEFRKVASAQYIEIYKSLTKMEFSLWAGDYGMDIRGSFDCVPGSLLSKLGNKPISSATPIAFAGKDALIAFAYAADSVGYDYDAQWKKFISLAKKWGIKTDWVSYEKKGINSKFILDPAALAAYVKAEGKAKFDELNKKGDELETDAMTLCKSTIETQSPEQACAFYVKGAKVALDAQTRFNKVLPNASKKPCAGMGVFSIYGGIKSIGEVVCPLIDNKDIKEAKAFLAKLPTANNAAIAAVWAKNGSLTHTYHIRANPAEIRGLYVFFQMMQAERQRKFEEASKVIEDAN